jgi:hypothetical protein
MTMIGFKYVSCGVAIALPVVLGGCGWSGYPDPGAASNPCYFADRRAPAGAAAVGRLPIGCVNAANLGAMAAEPGDLEHGRELAPADGDRAARAVAEYQAGKTIGAGPPTSMTGAALPHGIATGDVH